MSNIITIANIRGFIDDNGVAQLNAEDIARGFGFTTVAKSGNEVVRWARVNEYLKQFGFLRNVGENDFIPENMVYRLGFKASNETAQKFQTILADDILPTLRKTGTYPLKQESASKEEIQLRRAKAMEINARNRQANLLLKITADPICTKEYKQVIYSKVTQMVAGETLIPLPIAERKTYSATDIAKQFNITKNMIGKIANEHKLKTAEYGKLFYDKSPYSSKQVETWRYYENAIPMFAKILGVEVIGL